MESFMELLLDFISEAYVELMTHIFPKNTVPFKYHRAFVTTVAFFVLLGLVALFAWGCGLLGKQNNWGLVPIVVSILISAVVMIAGIVAFNKKPKNKDNQLFTPINREEHMSMTHHMNLRPWPFEMIAKGRKTIELRLLDEKRRQIAVGDTLIFTNTDDPSAQLRCRVLALHVFASFAQLYAALPLDQCGYLPEEIPTADPSDMDIYYPAEKQAEYGVLGIEIELA